MVRVVWRKGALAHLDKNYRYIKKDSPQAAEKVRDTIFDMTELLMQNVEMHPWEK